MEYKTFFITDNQEMGKNHQTGKIFSRLTGDRPKKSHVVKVILLDPIDDDGEVEELNVDRKDHQKSLSNYYCKAK